MKAAATVHHPHHVHHAPAAAAPWRLPFVFEYLLALPIGAVLALAWVNLDPESYYPFTYSVAFFVNEIAMVFFFGLITKEIVEATAPGGYSIPGTESPCRLPRAWRGSSQHSRSTSCC